MNNVLKQGWGLKVSVAQLYVHFPWAHSPTPPGARYLLLFVALIASW